MTKIQTKTQFPYICNKALKDGVLTEKPFTFVSGNFTQNLTEPQYQKLKELAVKEEKEESDKKQGKEKGEKQLTGLELLKSKYDSLKDKKSSEAAILRKQIKELEEVDKKQGK